MPGSWEWWRTLFPVRWLVISVNVLIWFSEVKRCLFTVPAQFIKADSNTVILFSFNVVLPVSLFSILGRRALSFYMKWIYFSCFLSRSRSLITALSLPSLDFWSLNFPFWTHRVCKHPWFVSVLMLILLIVLCFQEDCLNFINRCCCCFLSWLNACFIIQIIQCTRRIHLVWTV